MTTHSVCHPGRPGPPRRLPGRLAGLGRLPEHEIDRGALAPVLVHLDPGADLQRLDRLVGEQAVVGDRLGREVDAVAALVGPPARHESLDESDHVVDVGGGVGRLGRAPHAEVVHDVPPRLLVLRRPPPPPSRPSARARAMILSSMSVTLLTKSTSQARPLEVAAHDVPYQGEAAVADVGRRRRRSDRTRTSTSGPASRSSQLPDLARWQCRRSAARQYRSGTMPETVPEKPVPGRPGADVERALGDRRHLPLRPHRDPGPDLLHRHAAADRQRVAARRPRVLLHPHRHHRPLQAHAGPRGLVPDGLGRQRPAHRAPGPELLRGALRPVAPLRRRRSCRRPTAAEGAVSISRPNFVELCDRLTDEDERAFEELWRRARPVGRLDATPTRRSAGRPSGPSQRAFLRLLAPRRGLHRGRADAVGRRLPDRRVPGRARGPRTDRRLSPSRLPSPRRRRRLHRHDPPRAAGRLRRRRGPPRRRPLPSAVRLDGDHAPVWRRGAGHGPRVGRSGQGIRHRHDLHLRRRHRCGLVAGAGPADPERHRARRAAVPPRHPRAERVGRAAYAELAGKTVKAARRRIVELLPHRASCRARPRRSPTPSSSTRRATGRSRS